MDATTTTFTTLDGYLHSVVEKVTDCSWSYSSPSTHSRSQPYTAGGMSLSNCVIKTTHHHSGNNTFPHFEKIVSKRQQDGVVVSVYDGSFFTTGTEGIGEVEEDRSTGTIKSEDYLLEKLGSCEIPFKDRVKCEGLALLTGGNTRQLSARHSNIKEECTQNGSGDTRMKTNVNSDTNHGLSDLTSSLEVQSNINIMDTEHSCPHYKSQTTLEDHSCRGKTLSPRSAGTSLHETIKSTTKGHRNDRQGQRSTLSTQGRIYCDKTDPRKGHTRLNRSYILGEVKGFVLLTFLLALTACPTTLAAPSGHGDTHGGYYNTMDNEEQVERSSSENYKHSQVVGAVSTFILFISFRIKCP